MTFHEPEMLRVTAPRSGSRLCEAQRFMVPMRDLRIVAASAEFFVKPRLLPQA